MNQPDVPGLKIQIYCHFSVLEFCFAEYGIDVKILNYEDGYTVSYPHTPSENIC